MSDLNSVDRNRLVAVYERAKSIGLLGPGPVEAHIEHAQQFVLALEGVRGAILDLGSGAGVPGLAVALSRPDLKMSLADAMVKRCAFLRSAVEELVLIDRVRVLEGRAEDLARTEHRGQYQAVIARSFAAPAVTAECAVGFASSDGVIIVSEPPSDVERWPSDGLDKLSLSKDPTSTPSLAVLRRSGHLVDTYPRRPGIPEKRPLF